MNLLVASSWQVLGSMSAASHDEDLPRNQNLGGNKNWGRNAIMKIQVSPLTLVCEARANILGHDKRPLSGNMKPFINFSSQS